MISICIYTKCCFFNAISGIFDEECNQKQFTLFHILEILIIWIIHLEIFNTAGRRRKHPRGEKFNLCFITCMKIQQCFRAIVDIKRKRSKFLPKNSDFFFSNLSNLIYSKFLEKLGNFQLVKMKTFQLVKLRDFHIFSSKYQIDLKTI